MHAAPIVAVPKKDGTFGTCGEYKVTVNQDLDIDQHPLPKLGILEMFGTATLITYI